MKLQPGLVFVIVLLFSLSAFASPVVRVMDETHAPLNPAILNDLAQRIDMDSYREVRIQRMNGYALIYLLAKNFHRLDVARADFNSQGEVVAFKLGYPLQPSERQPLAAPKCPDPRTEFIVFAPNEDSLEQQVSASVAKAAKSHGLRTVTLLKKNATSKNYLDYMSCPALKGNFYDGDADPNEIVTYDGTLSATELLAQLPLAFREKVVNIWLACEAFNNPMLDVMLNGTASQKFAAGKNDLEVGPSDQTGACAMKAAMDGQPLTAAFTTCYNKLDVKTDVWGFAGNGSDYFGR